MHLFFVRVLVPLGARKSLNEKQIWCVFGGLHNIMHFNRLVEQSLLEIAKLSARKRFHANFTKTRSTHNNHYTFSHFGSLLLGCSSHSIGIRPLQSIKIIVQLAFIVKLDYGILQPHYPIVTCNFFSLSFTLLAYFFENLYYTYICYY